MTARARRAYLQPVLDRRDAAGPGGDADDRRLPDAVRGQLRSAALADRASTLRQILAELTAPDGGAPVARSVPRR
jgi:hypothetical protein